jgi:hypothetical protein
MNEARSLSAHTDGDHTSECPPICLLKPPERPVRGRPRGERIVRGVGVKYVRRKDVDLESISRGGADRCCFGPSPPLALNTRAHAFDVRVYLGHQGVIARVSL